MKHDLVEQNTTLFK